MHYQIYGLSFSDHHFTHRTSTSVLTGVTTYCKKCATCGTIYRYQEWAEGLHSFNDHLILTHYFCLYLRNAIEVIQV